MKAIEDKINTIESINKRELFSGINKLVLSIVKEVVPVIPNNKDTPNKKKPDAKAPNIKYLSPASDDFSESFFIAAKTYNDNDCNSKPKYRVIKSLEESITNIPRIEKSINTGYSKR